MILFYNKQTGDIFGTVDGRTHDPNMAEKVMIQPKEVKIEDVGKFIVPTKPIEEEIETPIIEHFANPQNHYKVEEKIVGVKKEIRVRELTYDVPFGDKLHRHENPKDSFNVLKCKVKLDKNGQIIDLIER